MQRCRGRPRQSQGGPATDLTCPKGGSAHAANTKEPVDPQGSGRESIPPPLTHTPGHGDLPPTAIPPVEKGDRNSTPTTDPPAGRRRPPRKGQQTGGQPMLILLTCLPANTGGRIRRPRDRPTTQQRHPARPLPPGGTAPRVPPVLRPVRRLGHTQRPPVQPVPGAAPPPGMLPVRGRRQHHRLQPRRATKTHRTPDHLAAPLPGLRTCRRPPR